MIRYIVTVNANNNILEDYSGRLDEMPMAPSQLGAQHYVGTVDELLDEAENMIQFGGKPQSDIMVKRGEAISKWLNGPAG
jgi:hypothetical protein